MNKVRILLVDPHTVVREGFKSLLGTQANFHVVGETASAKAALALAESLKPDLVLLDISAPGFKSATWIMHLQVYSPKTKLLVMAVRDNKRLAQEVLAAGAAGFLSKGTASDELVSAVNAAMHGAPPPEAVPSLAPGAQNTSKTPATGRSHSDLTEEEEDVAKLVSQGFSNQEIASQLGISPKCVAARKLRAMQKLKLRSRIDFVRYADAQGWLKNA